MKHRPQRYVCALIDAFDIWAVRKVLMILHSSRVERESQGSVMVAPPVSNMLMKRLLYHVARGV